MSAELSVLAQFGSELKALGRISDLLVAGSVATGNCVPGVSDLDRVAVTGGPVDGDRRVVRVVRSATTKVRTGPNWASIGLPRRRRSG
ncbi:hypothetical protein QTQ03_08425 [Micromonospora sp. WMMA1363]|uniref:hypothetical protein n=1 Tax=Micromonospora sp. WMMA1363 TaxID=3053985 RepID=UPI00259CCF12|nr:hypothetical protein [Micromonospora sp. WMMA1363]MDM4719609.1 hypothetical protein [Micromonospora sp. WMMA1363]